MTIHRHPPSPLRASFFEYHAVPAALTALETARFFGDLQGSPRRPAALPLLRARHSPIGPAIQVDSPCARIAQ